MAGNMQKKRILNGTISFPQTKFQVPDPRGAVDFL